MENNESDDEFEVNRRKTITKLEDFLKDKSEKYHQEQEDSKNQKNEYDIKKSKTLKEDVLKNISKGKVEYNNKKILNENIKNIIKDYNEKHKRSNYENIPDYISKKEDNYQLVKKCANQIYNNDLELPLIIIENEYFDNFYNFLENYNKYEEYKVIYVLKDKLLIKKNIINNYKIFHQEKKGEDRDNCFFAEAISTSTIGLYNEEQIKDIKKSMEVMSKAFKDNFDDEIKKWVGLIFNIISDYIIFNLKEKPLYYCCDNCKKPIIFKEKSFTNLLNFNNINNNIINDNNENNNDEMNKIQKRIEKKKNDDKKIIKNIINDKNKKLEFKSLFNVANNIIDLMDFAVNPNESSSNHNIANPPKKKQTNNGSINNVLYYTENKYPDFEIFERETSGAFILITDQTSLELTLNCIKKDNALKKFILLLQGQCCEKIINYLNQNNYLNEFGSSIIFTKNDKYDYLKDNYAIIKGIFKTKKQIIDYINHYTNQDGLYFTFKVINIKKYFDYYQEFHKTISSFYGQLSHDLYYSKINILKEFLDTTNSSSYSLMEALKVFEQGTNSKEYIIKGYTGNAYYRQFNSWLYSLNSLALEKTGYFLSGLIYSLNLFGEEKSTGVDKEIILYRGVALSYINILPYKVNVGNIITFPNFLSSSKNLSTAQSFASMNISSNNNFKVIFTIKYKFQNNWIPNAFNVVSISEYSGEEERLFQPYSFFLVKNVKIDTNNNSADIELETIGKTSILEEGLRNGKRVWYNSKENVMEVWNENN